MQIPRYRSLSHMGVGEVRPVNAKLIDGGALRDLAVSTGQKPRGGRARKKSDRPSSACAKACPSEAARDARGDRMWEFCDRLPVRLPLPRDP